MIYYNSERMINRIVENKWAMEDYSNTSLILKYFINRSGLREKCDENYDNVIREINRIYKKVDIFLDNIYLNKQKRLY